MQDRKKKRSRSRNHEDFKENRRPRRSARKTKWSDTPEQFKQIQFKNKLLARLYKSNKAILGTSQELNYAVGLLYSNDQKIMRKILLPQDNNFNYTGLLIGPQGGNQKYLEQKTGCKILVRGKGSQKQGQAPQPDDDQELHVLIIGDTDPQVSRACAQVERIIFADQETRMKIRKKQMEQHERIKTQKTDNNTDLSMLTPYGLPSENSFRIQGNLFSSVPNQCVGLVIGKDGETIKMIAKKSGARKVQVATASAPGSDTRNVFVQGQVQAIQAARKILQEIVDNQRKMNCNNVNGSYRMEVQVPFRMIGLVIGKGGETIKGINAKTGAFVCLSKQDPPNKNRKSLIITGPQNLCYAARYEIDVIVQNGLKNLQRTQKLMQDEMSMIKPLQYYPKQFQGVSFAADPEMDAQNASLMIQQITFMNPVMSSMLYSQLNRNCGPLIEEVIIEGSKKKKSAW